MRLIRIWSGSIVGVGADVRVDVGVLVGADVGVAVGVLVGAEEGVAVAVGATVGVGMDSGVVVGGSAVAEELPPA